MLLLLVLGLLELEALLRDTDEPFAIGLLELGDRVVVNGVDEEDFEALFLRVSRKGESLTGVEQLAGEVLDRLLDLGHASDRI